MEEYFRQSMPPDSINTYKRASWDGSLSLGRLTPHMSLTSAIAAVGFAMFVVSGCGTATVPRMTTFQAPPPKVSPEPPPRTLRPDLPQLSPPASAIPATLKDDDYRKVSGDYAYVDLEAVMLLIGRVDGRRGSVTRVEFFHGVAASVMVGELSPVEYLVGAGTKGDCREFKRGQVMWWMELSLGRVLEEA